MKSQTAHNNRNDMFRMFSALVIATGLATASSAAFAMGPGGQNGGNGPGGNGPGGNGPGGNGGTVGVTPGHGDAVLESRRGPGNPTPRQYASKPDRWHVRNHRERQRWYHRNVSRDHRFLPARIAARTDRREGFDRPRPRLYANLPARWHVRFHQERPAWYHRNVAARHRFLPNRIARQADRREFGRNNNPRRRLINAAAPTPAPTHHGGGHASSHCNGSGPGLLIGAALGGLAGSQFGNGSGQLAAVAAGTFLGAAIGGSAGCR